MRAAEAWGGKGGSALPPLYMGLTITLEELFSKLPKVGIVVGCLGRGRDFGFGAGQRLKLVVLPLKALMFSENFEEVSEAKELSLEFGFKLIILYIRILFLYSSTFKSPFQKGAGAMAMCLGVSPFLKGAFGKRLMYPKSVPITFFY